MAGSTMAKSKKTGTRRVAARPAAPYTTKIIKAGALLADTKTLLLHFNAALTVRQNLDQFRRENLFGKASRKRVEDVLAIFRQRYLGDAERAAGLAALVKNRLPPEVLDKILFFYACQSDGLLHDTVTELLAPRYWQGLIEVLPSEIETTLAQWVGEGKTSRPWSPPTLRRVAQGLLATLRDFGVLQGATRKGIAAGYLPLEAFAWLAFELRRQHASGIRIIEHPDWQLFFVRRDGIERLLIESHQLGLLEYHAAGSVTRLAFPTNTLEEYALVLAQRAQRAD